MANYFNQLSLRDQLHQLGQCRFMDLSEFNDGVLELKGKKIVITAKGQISAGKVIIATEGIKELKFEGELDPHAWQDLSNGRIYIKNIKNALTDLDPKNSNLYKKNFIAYDKILESMDKSTKDKFADIPKKNRKVITSHDAFLYFGRAYGIDFRSPVGVTTESEPSAGELAELITEMRKDNIKALFAENITDPRLIKQLAKEVNAQIGGTLYSDALSDNSEPANTYINMFKYNVNKLANILSK